MGAVGPGAESAGRASLGERIGDMVAVRSDDVHGRVIVDVDEVPRPRGEAAAAMNSFSELAAHCLAAQGVLYDTALRVLSS
jgi:hypothetical protein